VPEKRLAQEYYKTELIHILDGWEPLYAFLETEPRHIATHRFLKSPIH
jgi:hypothetical protein